MHSFSHPKKAFPILKLDCFRTDKTFVIWRRKNIYSVSLFYLALQEAQGWCSITGALNNYLSWFSKCSAKILRASWKCPGWRASQGISAPAHSVCLDRFIPGFYWRDFIWFKASIAKLYLKLLFELSSSLASSSLKVPFSISMSKVSFCIHNSNISTFLEAKGT